jgi:hypothetical protein
MMWVVTTTVSVPPEATAESLRLALEEAAVPAVAELAGLRSATWTIAEDHSRGLGFYVFETEDAARQRAATYEIGAAAPGGVAIVDVGLFEVLVDIRN